ncbi:MAG: hypothetical protein V7L00_10390 [Nostoc sp.]|nr:hypothetical protein [Nostoc sp. JL33]
MKNILEGGEWGVGGDEGDEEAGGAAERRINNQCPMAMALR